jgi:hypothetical protein
VELLKDICICGTTLDWSLTNFSDIGSLKAKTFITLRIFPLKPKLEVLDFFGLWTLDFGLSRHCMLLCEYFKPTIPQCPTGNR